MTSNNRATKYEQLHKSLKKHFKPLPEVGERTVLEHLLYACCLEGARAEQADEAFAKLQQAYFDWNEVRVTTAVELGEALSCLPNAIQAGHRIKKCLQSLFEARYQYDVDDLKKANLGKAVAEIEGWKGVTPFVLNYVSQQALGGHAIPAGEATVEALCQLEIITIAEAEKKLVPGVERAIPKNKGNEFSSLLHQFAIEFSLGPKNPNVLAVFKDLGVSPKPKQVVAKVAEKKPVARKTDAEPAPGVASSGTKTKASPSAPAATAKKPSAPAPKEAPLKSAPEEKKGALKKPEAAKPESKVAKVEPKPAAKKSEVKPAEAKKVDTKKAGIKKEPVKPAAAKKKPEPTGKSIDDKKKPVAKPKTTKKPTVKPPATKSSASSKITKKKPR